MADGEYDWRGGKEEGESLLLPVWCAVQWDLPNIWPPLEHMVIMGLYNSDNLEAMEQARCMAKTRVDICQELFTKTGHMYEKVGQCSFVLSDVLYKLNFSIIMMILRKPEEVVNTKYKLVSDGQTGCSLTLCRPWTVFKFIVILCLNAKFSLIIKYLYITSQYW